MSSSTDNVATRVERGIPAAFRHLPLLSLTVLLLSLALSLPGADTASPAVPRVVVPKLSGPVVIDGTLEEAVWAKAAALEPFSRNRDGSPEREQTQLRLWYDDQALYLGWTCHDTNIQATFTNRDSPLFQEDAVEFFVTAREVTNYFEFEWNPLGTVFDATIRNHLRTNGLSRSFHGDSEYTAKGMQSAARIVRSAEQDKLWTVEVRLPFADLNQAPPQPGEIWRGNAFRVNVAKGLPIELLGWSPTRRPGFHEPSRFGYLEFR